MTLIKKSKRNSHLKCFNFNLQVSLQQIAINYKQKYKKSERISPVWSEFVWMFCVRCKGLTVPLNSPLHRVLSVTTLRPTVS